MNWKQMVDSAFHAGSKESGKTQRAKEALTIRKKKEQARVKTIGKKLIEEVKELSQKIPSVESLDAFSREMISSIKKPEDLFKASSQMLKIAKIINKVQRETSGRIFGAKTENAIIIARNQFLARVNSVMKSSDKSIRVIEFFEKNSRRIPIIDSTNPIAVLAGYPNTGKTTILSRITSSKPKIASYAFTTQELNIGKMNYKFFEMQVIDTPGILDRAKEKRNEIERKAAAALKYLAKMIFFVMDSSLLCGFSMQEQMNLLEQIKNEFPETPLIVLLNKTDSANELEKEKFREELEKQKTEFIECGNGTEEKLMKELTKYLDKLKLEFK